MRSSLFAVAAAVAVVNAQGAQPAPSSTVVADPGTLPLGAECARTEQCAGGAQCFASNFMQITSCGKYNAACDNDSQCATNTCNNGLCNGFLASSAYLAQPSSTSSEPMMSIMPISTAGGIMPAPSSTVVAAAGSLPLGAQCATTEQCAGGAECFASTAWQIKSCGKFNSECSSDSQCATNTCQNGLCNGFLPEASYLANKPSSTSTAAGSASTAAGSLIPLGKSCNATSQCMNGAECTVSSAYQEFANGMVCGPYNATCTSNEQCSYNSCFAGRCTGVEGAEYGTSTRVVSGVTSLIAVPVTSMIASVTSARASITSSVGAVVNGTASRTASSTVSAYTGAAGRAGVQGGLAALFGAAAFLL
ncbi:hypothetical protein AUEXF2481DRAFT_262083 [Aureobasidium subglaciale EXF-2481]|uniref:Dickkopf N-terminal cysteine-rich domain-containing protein n=1 Tax=Aureobasidium subglaciale (strain EXF-2481) TaxID=1043005 RepID=A0A074YAP7_AURSE|nr:uncharacterized protein AUEXF2481DRAFT_262083 [Aureobasidium subglaciale EXF-2481]KAI5212337.1 hypothetical protein E4T38_00568 [Aureobasidium subglaciale]KAI5231723.1 hypothetical protein E4T40_00335 [Aureobasidium subglaciale]KAI5234430.1 hypothetical protein E4T41_00567 [Aureobasidium subglaciale]KAI5268092.1 hypothetical protein E4T46_00567 [Aureobasidium subglaciale]KEQ94845.1 hypothetical protein AUEXF2481DRAFT_262083 [Aureobasidium subglaciale EXF-2481]